jgi:hypothetical protein
MANKPGKLPPKMKAKDNAFSKKNRTSAGMYGTGVGDPNDYKKQGSGAIKFKMTAKGPRGIDGVKKGK